LIVAVAAAAVATASTPTDAGGWEQGDSKVIVGLSLGDKGKSYSAVAAASTPPVAVYGTSGRGQDSEAGIVGLEDNGNPYSFLPPSPPSPPPPSPTSYLSPPSSSLRSQPSTLDRKRRSRWNKDSSLWVGPTFNYADEGGVYAWGDAAAGGSTTLPVNIKASLAYGIAVERVFVNKVAFAALVEGGGVVTWGDAGGGGDSSAVAADLEKGVHTIYATDRAFAARKIDGTVVVWGDADYGGTDPGTIIVDSVGSQVQEIACTSRAFAALTRARAVHVWGGSNYGGTYDGSEPLVNIASIYANDYAFVAVTSGNSAIAWGDAGRGGSFSTKDVAGKMADRVARIWSTEQAFVALRYGTTTTTTTTRSTTTITTTTRTSTTSTITTSTPTASSTTKTFTETSTTTATTTTDTTTSVTSVTTTTTATTTTTRTLTTVTTNTFTTTTTRTTVTRTTTVTTVTATTRTETTTTTTHVCSIVLLSIVSKVAHCCEDETTVSTAGAECTSLKPNTACSRSELPDNALTGAEIASCDGIRPYCYAPVRSRCNDTATGIVGECNVDGQCAEPAIETSNIEMWKIVGPIIGTIGLIGIIIIMFVIHRKCVRTGGSSTVGPNKRKLKRQVAFKKMSATQINGEDLPQVQRPHRITGNGFLNKLANVEQGEILVMNDNGVVFENGVVQGGFKTAVRRLLHLNKVSAGQATKLRRTNVHDAENALKAAFTDFTRHEVARLRAQLDSSETLDAKLRDRLIKKLALVEQELDAAEEKETIEAAGGDYLQTHSIIKQLFKEQTMAKLQRKRQLSEQRSATAAMLRHRLTARMTRIEGEIREQSTADSVIMLALSKLEQNMVELSSLLEIIPNKSDKAGLLAYNMNKYRLITAVSVWTDKVGVLCADYSDSTELSKKATAQDSANADAVLVDAFIAESTGTKGAKEAKMKTTSKAKAKAKTKTKETKAKKVRF